MYRLLLVARGPGAFSPWSYYCTELLAHVSPLCNPVVYVLCNRQYRACVRKLLAKCCCCLPCCNRDSKSPYRAPAEYRTYTGCTLYMLRLCTENVPIADRTRVDDIPDRTTNICRLHAVYIPTTYGKRTDCLPNQCRQHTNRVLNMQWPHAVYIPTTYRQVPEQVSKTHRPHTERIHVAF